MEWWMWALIAGFAVLVLMVAVVLPMRRNRLRSRFGPEYDRTVDGAESQRKGEHALRDRLKAHRQLELRPLSPEAIAAYSTQWTDIQARFVDAPDAACADAEALLDDVLRERGYPVDEDFESQADLVSVDHPNLVQDYRGAHETHHGGQAGPSRTEDLRAAFVAYRGLFAVVLDDRAPSEPSPTAPGEESVDEVEARSDEPRREHDGADRVDDRDAEIDLTDDDVDAEAAPRDAEAERRIRERQ